MANNSIVLKGRGQQKEGQAAGALNPGYLVTIDSDGKVIPHGTAGGPTAPAFAKELEVFGRGIESAYAEDDTVIYEVFWPGHEVRAKIADDANIATGDLLESAGNGLLRAHDSGTALARCIEGVDNTGAGAEAFIKVEVL